MLESHSTINLWTYKVAKENLYNEVKEYAITSFDQLFDNFFDVSNDPLIEIHFKIIDSIFKRHRGSSQNGWNEYEHEVFCVYNIIKTILNNNYIFRLNRENNKYEYNKFAWSPKKMFLIKPIIRTYVFIDFKFDKEIGIRLVKVIYKIMRDMLVDENFFSSSIEVECSSKIYDLRKGIR